MKPLALLCAAWSTATLLAASIPATAAEPPIGVNAAVNPQSTGTPPAGTPQSLAIGQPIVLNERIATAESGQAKILFRDQSSLSVGPGSDLVVDRFIYDPDASKATLAMSATRGVFRFVGGEASKLDSPVTLSAPSAALGIRGGIFLARIAPDGSLTAIFVYGTEMTVAGRNGATTVVRRPGSAVSVDPAGKPSAPFAAPRDLIASLVHQFDGMGREHLASITEARLAATANFARLATAVEEGGEARLGGLRGSGSRLPFGSLPDLDRFDIRSVASQGDPGLRLLRLLSRVRQRAD